MYGAYYHRGCGKEWGQPNPIRLDADSRAPRHFYFTTAMNGFPTRHLAGVEVRGTANTRIGSIGWTHEMKDAATVVDNQV